MFMYPSIDIFDCLKYGPKGLTSNKILHRWVATSLEARVPILLELRARDLTHILFDTPPISKARSRSTKSIRRCNFKVLKLNVDLFNATQILNSQASGLTCQSKRIIPRRAFYIETETLLL